MKSQSESRRDVRTGWSSHLARLCSGAILFGIVSGLAITFLPFHAWNQWNVLIHTGVGILTLLPLLWYSWIHWVDYRHYAMSHVVLLGYVATAALLVCLASGVVLTWQGLFAIKSSWAWRQVHLFSTFATLVALLPHLVLVVVHMRREKTVRPVAPFFVRITLLTVIGLAVIVALPHLYSGTEYVNELPEDYTYIYGENRPFAPSLATTATGGAFDPRSLSGSESCGTAGCHQQILEEWQPSAHRYAAMDKLFQAIQSVMAEQNGPESTRYCGGCHDPISLFSGTKNVFSEELTGKAGYREGISCLVCHSVRETDLKGNANYVMTQPAGYLWQWDEQGAGRVLRDFLIRTYPAEHNKLSKRMFKAPEYCAACHKQFIDQEINRVGWVQLQNQYDNWAASHWNHKGDPTRTVECRECHMPLVASNDPAAGDQGDYNRAADDGMHRSHRFLASNQFMPELLEIEGWEKHVELTRQWLRGEIEIPEIRDKWATGPIVKVDLEVPDTVMAGDDIPLRVILTANKVGHDYPTGPLDIIQSWLEVRMTDENGREVWTSGTRDEKHFIEKGSFLFKAEPVDQYGNLIDRHNLWEMVGVRFRRALFPGYSDTVEYLVPCPTTVAGPEPPADPLEADETRGFDLPAPPRPGEYRISVALHYRKVDQFLLNFAFGEDSGITAPVTELARTEATVRVSAETDRAARDRKNETLVRR